MNADIEAKRGRPKRSDIDGYQAKAWYNTVSIGVGDDSAFRLEKLIQPENVKRLDGKLVVSRAWDKYRDGERLPLDGYKKDGRPGPVLAAGRLVPDSLYIYRHPIWRAMRSEQLSFDEVFDLVLHFKPSVRRYYLDLEIRDLERQLETFVSSFGQKIFIETDHEKTDPLDHLSINLMFLKMDNFRHIRSRFRGISINISKSLGPLSISPWIGGIYEELYDWLEDNVWKDMFDRYYPYGSNSKKGWRRSKHRWILPSTST